MTSDLLSGLEVCFKRDVLNKSMFTLLYFALLYCVYLLRTDTEVQDVVVLEAGLSRTRWPHVAVS